MTCGIYKITNTVNGRFYIGSSVDTARRWKEHNWDLYKNNHDNAKLQASFNKYGINNFKFEIVEEVTNKETLLSVEQKWLDKSGCLDRSIGFNIAPLAVGGSGPKSLEARIKSSEKQKGKPKSEEHKLKLKEIAKHRVLSEETRRKISEGNKGKKRSPETREKIRLARLGTKRSPTNKFKEIL